MPEVSTIDASRIVNTSDTTIRRHVDDGRLVARREGLRGRIRIDIEELRQFATKYQYRFDDELAGQLAR